MVTSRSNRMSMLFIHNQTVFGVQMGYKCFFHPHQSCAPKRGMKKISAVESVIYLLGVSHGNPPPPKLSVPWLEAFNNFSARECVLVFFLSFFSLPCIFFCGLSYHLVNILLRHIRYFGPQLWDLPRTAEIFTDKSLSRTHWWSVLEFLL